MMVILTAHARAETDDEPDVAPSGAKAALILEIDDCRQADPTLTPDQLRARGSEHYQRGGTLYIQGDYAGAIDEFVAAYCLIPFYTILKDIGQAYERRLEYELAIAYLKRYVAAVRPMQRPRINARPIRRRTPPTSCAGSRCSEPDGEGLRRDHSARHEDHDLEQRWHQGVRHLAEADRRARRSYQMTVEREGFEPDTQTIDVSIGRPFTTYVQLEPLKGTLSIQVTPPDARLFLGKVNVGVGSYTAILPSAKYQISAEAPGRQRAEIEIEVLPGQTKRELLELEPIQETGRRS